MVSIIIPVYNVEAYLEECLHSIIVQDYLDVQIICVNDGSTDSSLEILAKYANEYNNIEVYTKDNGGLSSARNFGIEKAKGEYIYFLDSDDRLADEKCLSFMAKRMNDNKLDVLCFDGESFFESEVIEKRNYSYTNYYERSKSYGLFNSGYELFRELLKDGQYRENMALKCIRRDLIIKNNLRFMEGLIYEDAFFSFALVLKAKRVEHVNRRVYMRRVRGGSITQKSIVFYNVYSMFCGYIGILDLLKHYQLDDDIYFEKYVSDLQHYIIELYNQTSEDERRRISDLNVCERHVLKSIIPKCSITEYIFPYHLFQRDSKVLLYGAGQIGKSFFAIAKNDSYVEIVGIADKRANELCRNSFSVLDVEEALKTDYDYILICVEKNDLALDIKKELIEIGIDPVKIKWDGLIYRWENYVKKKRIIDYVIDKKAYGKKYIYLLMLPEHGNLGDYLIGYNVQDYLANNFTEYELVNVTTEEWVVASNELKELIRPNDILVFSGGGFIGDVWDSGIVLKDIVKSFPYNMKFLMPNTLTYNSYCDEQICNDLSEMFKDGNTYICFRDMMSFDKCIEVGWSDYCIHVPDMALYGKPREYWIPKMNRVLLCMRSDNEKAFDNVDELKLGLLSRSILFDEYNICKDTNISQELGRRELANAFDEISKYRLVITDRLHVMLICYLSKTPCIAFDNRTHKVSEVFRWIESSGIVFCTTFDMDKIERAFKHKELIVTVNLDKEFDKLTDFVRTKITIEGKGTQE